MWKYAILMLVFLLPALGAEEAKKELPNRIPKEAERIDQFRYRYKDAKGKVWIYRESPFGIVKYEEPKADPELEKEEAAPSAPRPVKVTEDGDTLHFEKSVSIVVQRWSKKKSELTPEEKAMWEASKKAAAAKKGQE